MTQTQPTALSRSVLGLFMFVAACGGSGLEGPSPLDGATADATATEVSDTTSEPPDTSVTESDSDVVTTPDSSDVPDGVDVADAPDVVVTPAAWETFTLGDVGDIGDAFAVSSTLAYATSGNRVLRWNGKTWLTYGEPNGQGAIHGVWADEDEVVAVGDDGFVGRRVDGADWETLDVGLTGDQAGLALWDVDGRADDDLWVVGDKGQVRHWDGTSWTEAYSKATVNLRSAFVDRTKTGAIGIYAVGNGGQLVSNVDADSDGTADGFATSQIAAGAVTLTDVLVKADGTVIAVGSGHTITAKRPVIDPTFKGQATNDERDRDVAALALAPDGKLYAFGAEGLVLVQNGTTWSTVSDAIPSAGLKNFAAAMVLPGASTRIIALAAEGGGAMLTGTTWSVMATRPEAAVKDLEAAPDGTLWAAGSLGLLVKRGPDGFTTLVLPSTVATKNLEAVTVAADGTVWAVGEAGTILKASGSSAPELVASPVPLDLFGVASKDDTVVACGRGGTLIQLDAGVPSVRVSGSTADLRAVAFGGDGALWVAGSFGTLLRSSGLGVPLPVLSGVGGSLNDMTATATGVLVVGDNGDVLACTATGAELVSESTGVFLQGVAVRGAVRYAVGWNGVIQRDDSVNPWTTEVSGTNLILEAVWLGPDEAIAAGRQGVLLRRLETP